MSALGRLKDVAFEKGLLVFLRPKVERYGELKILKLNTSKKLITAEIHLLGDSAPLVISQARYHFEQDGERLFAAIHDVIVSKPWLQNLIDDHFEDLRLEVPQSLKTWVKHLM